MNHIKILLIFSLFSFSTFLHSCKSNQKQQQEIEIAMIDSLFVPLNQTKEILNFDINEIKERTVFIDSIEVFFKFYNQTTPDPETSLSLDKLFGIKRIYATAIKQYTNCVLETEELFIQLNTLKQSVMENKYSKEEFKKYLAVERKDIYENLNFGKKFIKPVSEIEQEFNRSAEKVNLFMQNNPGLKQ